MRRVAICLRQIRWSVCGAFCIVTLLVASLQAQERYWIILKDKGIARATFHPGDALFEQTRRSLSKEALLRRMSAAHLPEDSVINLEDAPVESGYLNCLKNLGVHPHTISKWANAVSAELDSNTVVIVGRLPFVQAIEPVLRSLTAATEAFGTSPFEHLSSATQSVVDTVCDYDPVIYHYGYAQSQLDRINVTPLHAMGYDATKVVLGFLDTGFRWREISSLAGKNVLFEHDYVFGDSITENQISDDPNQETHGTTTLSTATGYQPDSAIGPAYNASLLLAKTEDIRSETPREEDNYAAALEDFEARGVQVTSSSVGYFGFDSGWTSYTKADLNGHTTISAKALSRAAKLGVLCVTANGNNGGSYMLTPADADSVISVGALDPIDTITGFSSLGPTADGRIKPEVVAPGQGVWAQAPDGSFRQFTGTSYATPLTSGACCLIRQTHPEASAQSIRSAILRTADNAKSPNNTYGWGKINAYAAALDLGTFAHVMKSWVSGDGLHVCASAASKFRGIMPMLNYISSIDTSVTMVPMQLMKDSLIFGSIVSRLPLHSHGEFWVTVQDFTGPNISTPRYPFAIERASVAAISVMYTANDLLALAANYPGTWTLMDLNGRIVRSIETHIPQSGIPLSTRTLPTAVYFLRFAAENGESRVMKVLVSH